MGIYSSVVSGLEELKPMDPRDEAVAELALSYARAMEDGSSVSGANFGIDQLGPKLLAALVQLRMTPQARSAVLVGEAPPGAKADPLDEIRQRRQRHLGA